MSIQLHITKLARGYNEKDYRVYDHEDKYFDDLNEANKWIKETYDKHKRDKMYVDTKEGKSKHIGYVIGFRSEEYNPDTGKEYHFLEQHWIEFRTIKVMELST